MNLSNFFRYTAVTLLFRCFSIEAFDLKEVYFELYTRANPRNYQVLKDVQPNSIYDSVFSASRPTKIFVHGFRTERERIDQYARAYMQAGDFNFIAMNWIEGAYTPNYVLARGRVESAGLVLAELIAALTHAQMNLKDLVVVGHSLGAHIAGRAGKKLSPNAKIGTIIALDPASPLFDLSETEYRLTNTDAEYVQVIHTNADDFGFGIKEPIGHADFYPNGGAMQPGCLPMEQRIDLSSSLLQTLTHTVGCSHERSHEFFLESLTSDFPSIQCNTKYYELTENKCTPTGVKAKMGGDISVRSPYRPQGTFYLETRSYAPYAISDVSTFNKIQLYDSQPRHWTNRLLSSSPLSFIRNVFSF